MFFHKLLEINDDESLVMSQHHMHYQRKKRENYYGEDDTDNATRVQAKHGGRVTQPSCSAFKVRAAFSTTDDGEFFNI